MPGGKFAEWAIAFGAEGLTATSTATRAKLNTIYFVIFILLYAVKRVFAGANQLDSRFYCSRLRLHLE
jgi:hypothetical protein